MFSYLRRSNDETFYNRQHAISISDFCMATNPRDIFNCERYVGWKKLIEYRTVKAVEKKTQ